MILRIHLSLLAIFCLISLAGFSQASLNLDVWTPASGGRGDVQIRSGSSATNYSGLTTSNVSVTSSSDAYRFLLNFDLSSIPSNAVITLAELRLTPTTVGEGTVTSSSFIASAMTISWNQSTATYSNANSFITANQQTTSNLVSGKRVFDLKNMIQAAVNGSQPITGISVRRNPETTATTACQYYTTETTTSNNDKPKLVITYHLQVSITSATINHSATSSSGDGSISVSLSGGSGSLQYAWYNLSQQWTNSTTPVSVTGSSTTLTGLNPGVYGLKVSSTTSSDVFYYAFLVGQQCDMATFNFYPGSYFTDDANISQLNPTVNEGSSNFFDASYESNRERLCYMRFRLWFDPEYSALSAKLNLTGYSHLVSSSPTNDAAFYYVNQNWDELLVNYNNKPTINGSVLVDVPATTTTTQNQLIEMGDFWNLWKQNNLTNYGMRFQLDSYGSGVDSRQKFYSSDVNYTLRPYFQLKVDNSGCDRTSYAAFKRKQDGALISTHKGKLKVYFTEEYQQTSAKVWPMKLYNSDHTMIAAIDYNGNAIGGLPLLPAVAYTFSDNRTILNLNSLGLTTNATYLLELTKSTGEIEFIEFVFKP